MPTEAIAKTRQRTNTIYVAVVGLLVVFYVLGAVVLARAVASDNRARRIAEETQKTLAQAGALLTTALEAETSQRGYLLSGEAGYLMPYSGKRAQFAQELATLREHVGQQANSVLQREALDRVAEASDRRFDLMDQGIAARARNDLPAAITIIESGDGKAAMDSIRAEIDAIRSGEQARLSTAFAQARALQDKTAAGLGMLLLVTLVALISASVLGRRAIQAEAAARLAHDLRTERDRADLVSRELSHRVKNLFAVIMSIVSTTGRAETDAREAARKIRERIQALSRAHVLSGGQDAARAARLGDLVRAIVLPYVPQGREVALDGPEIWLSADRVTPVGLILNELATNSLKYGAWTSPTGTLSIAWAFDGTHQEADGETKDGGTKNLAPFRLIWTETLREGGVSDPARHGFGTQMIELSAAQAHVEVSRDWREDGLTVVLRFEWNAPAGDEGRSATTG